MRTTLFRSAFLPCIAAVLLGVSAGAYAQFPSTRETSVDRSFDPAPKDCADVRWSQATLRVFPSIASACQSIEQRNGKTYVKLEGTVEDVKDQGKRIRIDFEDGGTLTFRPTPRTNLYIDGKRTPFADLDDEAKLNFYIPEDRLQAELQPEPDRFAFIIFPFDVTSTADASVARSAREAERSLAMNNEELPRTAGPLPLMGIGGALLLTLAAGATLRRKRRGRMLR